MRYDLLQKTFTQNSIDFYNLFSIDWSTFEINNILEHIVDENEVARPYLIANLYYGDVNLIDVLLLINKVPDFFDLKVGQKLMIPPKSSIENFILRNSK
jgi:hypothetical protein